MNRIDWIFFFFFSASPAVMQYAMPQALHSKRDFVNPIILSNILKKDKNESVDSCRR
jgi:hypothetical protein